MDISSSLTNKSSLEIEWVDGFYRFYNICQVADVRLLCYGSMESERMSKTISVNVPWLSGLKDLCTLIGQFCGGYDTTGIKTLIKRYETEIQNLIEDGH